MNITLYDCLSSPNYLTKQLSSDYLEVEFVAKKMLSLFDPIIEVYTEQDISKFNYGFIADWRRFYFIDPHNVRALAENRYEIQLECDSLTTFKDQLVDVPCIIDRTENYGGSPYLNSEAYVANCKHKTDIIQFPSGLNDTGEFILITAGG